MASIALVSAIIAIQGSPPSTHESDTTNDLRRCAVEVILRQNGETDFGQFRLKYGPAQIIVIYE